MHTKDRSTLIHEAPEVPTIQPDSTDTPTPEQIEVANRILAETTSIRPDHSGAVAVDPATGDTNYVPSIINLAKQEELTEKFLALIGNPRFWEKENRLLRLEAALVLPEYDDPSMRMFFNSAEDELRDEEMERSIKENRIASWPTKEQIIERAEFKYHEKYVLEPQRKAEREAKRKARTIR